MRIEHSIEIEAPAEIVWDVTEDVERWPEWSPAMKSVRRLDQGPFDVGSRALIRQQAMSEAEWDVTAMTRGERFEWETRKPGMRMVGVHEVRPSPAGTRSLLAIEVYGLLGRVLWPLLILPMRWALRMENQGLKRHCEARASR